MLDLLRAMDVAETGAAFTAAADVAPILDRPGLGLGSDTWAVSDPVGLGGFTVVEVLEDRCQLRAPVGLRPAVADVAGALLVGWVEHRARKVAADRGWSTATGVAWQLPGGVAEPVLGRRGWVKVRRYHHLTRGLDLTGPCPAPRPGGGSISVVPDDRAAGQVHEVLETALAGHWEHHPRPLDRFLADKEAATGYDRSLWLLAHVDSHPAAAVIARHRGDRSWIALVGTVPAYRARGLASGLLAAAMTELTRRESVGIDLDVDTGALRLYETAGFRTEYQLDQWRHTTPAAQPPPPGATLEGLRGVTPTRG